MEAFRATRANGAFRCGWIFCVRSLAVDCSILGCLLGNFADKGFLAFLFSESCLRHVVRRGGGLRCRFVGIHCGIGLSKHE
jgi:hypothetical protein